MPNEANEPRSDASQADALGWYQRGVNALQLGLLDEAERSFGHARAWAPEQPAARLGQAAVLALRGRNAEAIACIREILLAAPGFMPAQRQLADLLREVDPAEAGQWFTRCARRDPDAAAIGGALLMAARLQRLGHAAPPAALQRQTGRTPGLISVVICSIRPHRLAAARARLSRAFGAAAWELVHIDDARSLCEGYARGLARSRGDLLVFCHDDIEVVGDHWAQRLRDALEEDDVVGVAGTTRLSGANWVWAGAPHAHGWVAQVRDGRILAGAYALDGPRIGAIESLDGIFIATRRAVALQLGFDAATYDGFHLYDTDFCWRARRAGLRLAVRTDLPLVHWSQSGFDANWARYARRFLARSGLKETPMAAIPGAMTAVDGIDALPALHGWLAHWVRQA